MRDVGLRLREAREAREMSLEDIARITRIPRATLEAIEEGDTTGMPPVVYVRGFVRSYATTVGLDANELLHQLSPTSERLAAEAIGRSASQERGGSDAQRFERVLGFDNDGRRGAGLASSHFILLLLAAGMFLAGWFMVGTRTSRTPAATSPSMAVPAIQEHVDGVSQYTSTRNEIDAGD